MADRAGDPAALAAGYERLREAVLSARPDGWRLGRALLASRGMAAWIATFPALDPGPAPASDSNPTRSNVSSLPCTGEVVAVLAQMALAHAA